MEEAIKGYNEEKKILATRLGQLGTSNEDIGPRGSLESRLEEIDKCIMELCKGGKNHD